MPPSITWRQVVYHFPPRKNCPTLGPVVILWTLPSRARNCRSLWSTIVSLTFLQTFMAKHKINPLKNMAPVALQAPIFMSMFLGLRGDLWPRWTAFKVFFWELPCLALHWFIIHGTTALDSPIYCPHNLKSQIESQKFTKTKIYKVTKLQIYRITITKKIFNFCDWICV